MTKFHRASERSWADSVTLEELQHIARESIGRDRSTKDVDDWCKGIWNKPQSPSIRSSPKRKAREDEWIEKLEMADGRPKGATRRIDIEVQAGGSADQDSENLMQADMNLTVPQFPATPPRLRAFGSVTNILGIASRRLVLENSPPTAVPLPTPKPSDNSVRDMQLMTCLTPQDSSPARQILSGSILNHPRPAATCQPVWPEVFRSSKEAPPVKPTHLDFDNAPAISPFLSSPLQSVNFSCMRQYT